MFDMPAIESCV